MNVRRRVLAATTAGDTGSSSAGSSSAGSSSAGSSGSAESSMSTSDSAESTAGSASSGGSSSGAPADDPNLLKGKMVWYADVIDSNPLVTAIAQAINDKLTANGATMTRSFAINNTTGQLDLGVQADAMVRALAANPAAIAYFVIDPKSLKPQVNRAREAGIPVYAAFGKPDGFDVDAYITLDDE